MTTTTVSTTAELISAFETLSQGQGGTILLAPGSEVFDFSRTKWQAPADLANAPVTIRSADPEDPAVFSQISLVGRNNVTIDSVVVDTTTHPEPVSNAVAISALENFAFLNSHITGGATGPRHDGSEHGVGPGLFSIRSSQNVRIENNLAEGGNHGMYLYEATGVIVAGNEMRHMQGDGIRIAGVQDLEIRDNFLHDFYGTEWKYNHGDYIQFWGLNIPQNNERIAIRDNVLQSGAGSNYQMIFGGNEDFGKTGQYFKDFEIEGNVISGSHWHMLSLGNIENLSVRNNTLLWDRSTADITAEGPVLTEGANGWLRYHTSLNVAVENNLAGSYGDGLDAAGNNVTVAYSNPDDPNYYAKHFVNLDDASAANVSNIVLRPDSAWNGKVGAPMTWTTEETGPPGAVGQFRISDADMSVVTLDAGLSRDAEGRIVPEGTDFRWIFADGAVLTGPRVTVDFDRAGVHDFALEMREPDGGWQRIDQAIQIGSPDLLTVSVTPEGAVDTSGRDGSVFLRGAADPAALIDGGRIRLDGDSYIDTGRHPHLYDLPAFTMGFDIDLDPGSWGQMFMLHKSMTLILNENSTLAFRMLTADGSFEAVSKRGVLGDGPHRIAVSYDGETMHILVDGAVVASAEASGNTQPAASWQPTWGNPWGRSVEGWISDIAISAEPAVAGDIATPDHTIGDPIPDPQPQEPQEEPEPDTPDPSAGDGPVPDDFLNDISVKLNPYAEAVTPADVVLLEFSGAAGFTTGDGGETIAVDSAALSEAGLRLGAPGTAAAIDHAYIAEALRSEAFDIDFTIDADSGLGGGEVFRIHHSLQAIVAPDGTLVVSLMQDDGKIVQVRSAGVDLLDQAAHRVTIAYGDGQLALSVDGIAMDAVALDAPIFVYRDGDLLFGNPSGQDNFDGYLTDMEIGTEQEDARHLLSDPDEEAALDTLLFYSPWTGFLAGEEQEAVVVDSPAVTGLGLTMNAQTQNAGIAHDRVADALHAHGIQIDFTIEADGDLSTGHLFSIHKSLHVVVDTDGSLVVGVWQDDDTFIRLRSKGVDVADRQAHDVRIAIDEGTLALSIDGAVVDTATAVAPLNIFRESDLVFGSRGGWDTFDGTIRYFELGVEPDREDNEDRSIDIRLTQNEDGAGGRAGGLSSMDVGLAHEQSAGTMEPPVPLI